MNMDSLNKWLTLAANIGVIAGIVFLGVELQQNNELLQAESSIAYVNMRVDGLSQWGNDKEFLETFVKAEDGEELTRSEYLSLDFKYWSMFVNWEWEYEQYIDGSLEVLNQPPELRWRQPLNDYPRIKESWGKHKNSLSPDFVNYMEGVVLN